MTTYKCYGVELIYPIDDKTLVGYQEYAMVNDIKTKVNAILVVRVGESGSLSYSDPDGAEREYWLNRIGVLSNEEFASSTKKLKGDGRRLLYDELKLEFGEK